MSSLKDFKAGRGGLSGLVLAGLPALVAVLVGVQPVQGQTAPPTAPATAADEATLTTPTPTPIVADQLPPVVAAPLPTVAAIFFSDPRVLAVTIPDLPGGVHAWAKVGDDTTRLLQFQYSIIYGRMADNGQVFPLDPYFGINVFIADTVDHAQAAWIGQYQKPGAGQRPGTALPAIADEQAYGLGKNLIDVRARQANVILQAIEWTSGTRPISLDDSVTLVRIMASRARDLAR